MTGKKIRIGLAATLAASLAVMTVAAGLAAAHSEDDDARLHEAVGQLSVRDAATVLFLAETAVRVGQQQDRVADAQATLDRAHMSVRSLMQDAGNAAEMLCHADTQIGSDLSACLAQHLETVEIVQQQLRDAEKRIKGAPED